MVNSNKQVINPPFKMSEDDGASNYIFKLQRHNQFYLSGWNDFRNLDKSNPNLWKCDVNNIKETPVQMQITGKILAWDIEVRMKNAIFKNCGLDPENYLICIGVVTHDLADNSKKSACFTVVQGLSSTECDIIYAKTEYEIIMLFADYIATT